MVGSRGGATEGMPPPPPTGKSQVAIGFLRNAVTEPLEKQTNKMEFAGSPHADRLL